MFKKTNLNSINHISLLCIVALGLSLGCSTNRWKINSDTGIISKVDPFIGTGGHGHTYPGATTPFGMVQLSPDTRLKGWDGCSGYHYSDSVIYGFSHTHLSGTGVADYCDILVMPTNHYNDGSYKALEYGDFQSRFSHKKEWAHPGFYAVYLEGPQVQAQLTSSTRVGFHHYTFKNPQAPSVVLDLLHRDEVLDANMRQVGNKTIEGHRFSKSWAKNQKLFFVLEFSEDIESATFLVSDDGKSNHQAVFGFKKDLKQLTVKVAVSPVDVEGAHANMRAEGQISFDQARNRAEQSWDRELSKIEADFDNQKEATIFYTSLYHTMLAPNTYSDVDGRYRGMDDEIHRDTLANYYTVFSLWDTYRATHPLYTIIDRKRSNEFVLSMLHKYDDGGIMSIWDLASCYTGCMIGYHGVSMIADAFCKGIQDYDHHKALDAMIHSANQDHLGLDEYKQNGFIAVEGEAESVSKTLEYSYDDWCISQMALSLGREDDYRNFLKRGRNYRNLFDEETNFFRPRRKNRWLKPFDPFEVNSNYTEANAWQYAFGAPQDMEGHISLMGGPDVYDQFLDDLFEASSKTTGRDQADITGLIGQYAHGNEPSHHIAYLYNDVYKPHKTQAMVRKILATQYSAEPDGISGNEDCGQMGAWYVFSALGFYPVLPGSPQYYIGSPLVKEAKIHLENGKTFTVVAENQATDHIYVKQVSYNGQTLNRPYLSHDQIEEGGTLRFVMSDVPSIGPLEYEIGSQINDEDAPMVFPPLLVEGQESFVDSTVVKVAARDIRDQLWCSIDDGPYQAITANEGIHLHKDSRVCVYASDGNLRSSSICTDFKQRAQDMTINLISAFDPMYNGGAEDALIDGLTAGDDFRTGGWQGFQGKDFSCELLLKKPKRIKEVEVSFLQDENSWIFFPKQMEVYGSSDGSSYQWLGRTRPMTNIKAEGIHKENLTVEFKEREVDKIKIIARGVIDCPPWHKGAEYNGKSWLFLDEISIK